MRTSSASRGFHLIELLVALGIVAVLTAVALPSYVSYLNRAKMTEGITLLSALRNEIVQFHQSHGRLPDSDEVDEMRGSHIGTRLVTGITAEAPPAPVADGGSGTTPPGQAVRETTPAAGRGNPQAGGGPADAPPAAADTIRLIAQMNAAQFPGMRSGRNDWLMLEGRTVAGTILWTCGPHPTQGVYRLWLPSSCQGP